MKTKIALAALSLLFCASAALGDPADRASIRTDSTRAKAEGRFNRLQQDQTQPAQQEVIQEKTITVPAKKTGQRSALEAGLPAKPTTKRIVVRKLETVQKPAPLRINPY